MLLAGIALSFLVSKGNESVFEKKKLKAGVFAVLYLRL